MHIHIQIHAYIHVYFIDVLIHTYVSVYEHFQEKVHIVIGKLKGPHSPKTFLFFCPAGQNTMHRQKLETTILIPVTSY